jgi:hypothetical protein
MDCYIIFLGSFTLGRLHYQGIYHCQQNVGLQFEYVMSLISNRSHFEHSFLPIDVFLLFTRHVGENEFAGDPSLYTS